MGLLLDLVGRQDRGQRQAGAERLRQREDVGHDPVALEREHRAGAAEPGLGLVEHEQHAAFLAAGLERGEVAGRQVEDAAGREHRLGDERRRCTGALPVDEVERVVELGEPVELTIGRDEARSVRVRCEHRHRSHRCRAVAATPGRVRRRSGATRHAVPALGEPDDLPPTGHDLRHAQGRLVRLGARRQQQDLRQPGRERAQRLGEIDHRPREHAREEVVEPADHLGDDSDDLRVGVPEDRAHLTTREVEDPPACCILDERARRSLRHER